MVLCIALVTLSACGENEDPTSSANSATPSYNTEATETDEGVQVNEDGELVVPSYSEGYGNSNGKLIVTTPEVDGNYDVLTYNFPNSTLESITYESHFADEAQAKTTYDQMQTANVSDLKLDGNVVTYTSTDSDWIGYKKRDLIDNLSKTWEQLGYQVTNE